MKSFSSVLAATAGVVGMVAISIGPASAQHWNDSQSTRSWSGSAHSDGYYAYGAVGPRMNNGRWVNRDLPITRDTPAPGSSRSCVGEQASDSAFPSWMCR
jgi:hypothetical protein